MVCWYVRFLCIIFEIVCIISEYPNEKYLDTIISNMELCYNENDIHCARYKMRYTTYPRIECCLEFWNMVQQIEIMIDITRICRMFWTYERVVHKPKLQCSTLKKKNQSFVGN